MTPVQINRNVKVWQLRKCELIEPCRNMRCGRHKRNLPRCHSNLEILPFHSIYWILYHIVYSKSLLIKTHTYRNTTNTPTTWTMGSGACQKLVVGNNRKNNEWFDMEWAIGNAGSGERVAIGRGLLRRQQRRVTPLNDVVDGGNNEIWTAGKPIGRHGPPKPRYNARREYHNNKHWHSSTGKSIMPTI